MPSRHTSRVKNAPPAAWPERLRAAGLRSTALTLAVLQRLETASQPYSHEDLAQELAEDNPSGKVDRVTLYRILDRLTLVDLIAKIQGSDRVARYTLTHASAAGYFECDQCHSVTALPSDPALTDVLARMGRRVNRSGAHSTKASLTLHGTCKNCVHPHR